MTLREMIHALQRDSEPIMVVIPGVDDCDIEGRGNAL